jgi:hypothetical protein
MSRARYKDRNLQAMFDACRLAAADNFSEFYYGAGPIGPRWPRTGAGHRCAYWAGYRSQPNRMYSRGTYAYAAYQAGVADRRAHQKGCR